MVTAAIISIAYSKIEQRTDWNAANVYEVSIFNVFGSF